MKQDKNAWKKGALWIAETEWGTLHAIILDKGRKPGHKLVWMKYTDDSYDKPIWQNYSHRHIIRHFKFSGKIVELPKISLEDWPLCLPKTI